MSQVERSSESHEKSANDGATTTATASRGKKINCVLGPKEVSARAPYLLLGGYRDDRFLQMKCLKWSTADLGCSHSDMTGKNQKVMLFLA